jgi:mannosyltransferase
MRRIKRALSDHWELLVIAVVAVALRLPYIEGRSLWFDEASSWRTASFAPAEMMHSLRLNVHLPLYYLLLKVWMAGFGESVAALRGLSIACGTLTVILMGLFGRELYAASGAAADDEAPLDGEGWRARAFGLATASLVAVSPYQVLGSIEARMYALGTALAALGGWLLLRALRGRGGNWTWAGYGLACVALLYTHHYALFTIAAQFVFLALYGVSLIGAGAGDEARRLATRAAAVGAIVALAYLPALQFLLVQADRVRQDYWIGPLDWRMLRATFGQFVVPVESPGVAPTWGWAVLGAFAISVALIVPGARRGDGLVLASALGPMIAAAAAATITPIWVPRYFRFAHLFVLATIALAVWRVSRDSRILRVSCVAAVCAGLLAANVAFWRALDLTNGPGPRGAVDRILAERRGDEPIIVLDLYQYLPISYYARQHAVVRLVRPTIIPFWGPHVIRPGDLIEPEAIAQELHRGVWVVGTLPVPANISALEDLTPDHGFVVTFYLELHKKIYVTHYVARHTAPGSPPTCDRRATP